MFVGGAAMGGASRGSSAGARLAASSLCQADCSDGGPSVCPAEPHSSAAPWDPGLPAALTVLDPIHQLVPKDVWLVEPNRFLELHPELRVPNISEIHASHLVSPVHEGHVVVQLLHLLLERVLVDAHAHLVPQLVCELAHGLEPALVVHEGQRECGQRGEGHGGELRILLGRARARGMGQGCA